MYETRLFIGGWYHGQAKFVPDTVEEGEFHSYAGPKYALRTFRCGFGEEKVMVSDGVSDKTALELLIDLKGRWSIVPLSINQK